MFTFGFYSLPRLEINIGNFYRKYIFIEKKKSTFPYFLDA